MSICPHSRRILVLGVFLLVTFLPLAANADQIVVLVDESGRKIYVNASEASVDFLAHGLRTDAIAISPRSPANINDLVEQTASRYQVDPDLIRAIIRVESDYDPKAVSNKGAMGLMQLVPATAHRFGVSNPFDPKQNLDGGVNYLRHLLDTFGGDLNRSLAAYNAGEHTVQRAGGVPAIAETQNYVRKVTHIYQPAGGAVSERTTNSGPPSVPIVRYIDEHGVVHYTNVE